MALIKSVPKDGWLCLVCEKVVDEALDEFVLLQCQSCTTYPVHSWCLDGYMSSFASRLLSNTRSKEKHLDRAAQRPAHEIDYAELWDARMKKQERMRSAPAPAQPAQHLRHLQTHRKPKPLLQQEPKHGTKKLPTPQLPSKVLLDLKTTPHSVLSGSLPAGQKLLSAKAVKRMKKKQNGALPMDDIEEECDVECTVFPCIGDWGLHDADDIDGGVETPYPDNRGLAWEQSAGHTVFHLPDGGQVDVPTIVLESMASYKLQACTEHLMGMGFSAQDCEKAARLAGGKILEASELLLNHGTDARCPVFPAVSITSEMEELLAIAEPTYSFEDVLRHLQMNNGNYVATAWMLKEKILNRDEAYHLASSIDISPGRLSADTLASSSSPSSSLLGSSQSSNSTPGRSLQLLPLRDASDSSSGTNHSSCSRNNAPLRHQSPGVARAEGSLVPDHMFGPVVSKQVAIEGQSPLPQQPLRPPPYIPTVPQRPTSAPLRPLLPPPYTPIVPRVPAPAPRPQLPPPYTPIVPRVPAPPRQPVPAPAYIPGPPRGPAPSRPQLAQTPDYMPGLPRGPAHSPLPPVTASSHILGLPRGPAPSPLPSVPASSHIVGLPRGPAPSPLPPVPASGHIPGLPRGPAPSPFPPVPASGHIPGLPRGPAPSPVQPVPPPPYMSYGPQGEPPWGQHPPASISSAAQKELEAFLEQLLLA